jgi:hypothetical protein
MTAVCTYCRCNSLDNPNKRKASKISGSHGDEYEDGCLQTKNLGDRGVEGRTILKWFLKK